MINPELRNSLRCTIHNAMIDGPRLESDLQSDFDAAVDGILDNVIALLDLAIERTAVTLKAGSFVINPVLADPAEEAWKLYCKETAGDMHVADSWEQLSDKVKAIYLNKVTLIRVATDALSPAIVRLGAQPEEQRQPDQGTTSTSDAPQNSSPQERSLDDTELGQRAREGFSEELTSSSSNYGEMITVDGREYRKFIRYPEEVTDGTLRCIRCGQIDEDEIHDHALCVDALSTSSVHPLARFRSPTAVRPGLYRVHWKSGGSSLAAIGMGANGNRWIAPTNWIRPADMPRPGTWGDIERLEPIVEQRLAHYASKDQR